MHLYSQKFKIISRLLMIARYDVALLLTLVRYDVALLLITIAMCCSSLNDTLYDSKCCIILFFYLRRNVIILFVFSTCIAQRSYVSNAHTIRRFSSLSAIAIDGKLLEYQTLVRYGVALLLVLSRLIENCSSIKCDQSKSA